MKSGCIVEAALAVVICSPAIAQTAAENRQAVCSNDMAQVDALSTQLGQSVLWDDGRIAKAKSSLAKLQSSRTQLIRMTMRLNNLQQSADNAEAFDRNGEANVWRRDAADLRAQIDSERKKAGAWAADAGVSCPGCTYSVEISKVQAAVDGAVAARARALQTQQQIASYKAEMAANACSGQK